MSGITDKELEAELGTSVSTPIEKDGFIDPSQSYPTRRYSGIQSTNLEARGIEENLVPFGGGDVDVDLEIREFGGSMYPYNQVRKTASGHVTEFDDTPGRNRILIMHNCGTGIEMMPDGTVIINTSKNMIRIAAGDEKVIIEGDGEVVYHGNLKMRVDGNFDLNVGGDLNIDVGGDHSEDIKGGYRQDINKNFQSIINKNVSQQIIGNETRFIHGSHTTNIKGATSFSMADSAEFLSQGILRHTSRTEAVLSSPSINIGASSLLVAGDSGTIGGENIIMYNYNMYTGHSITANDTITTHTAYTTRAEATEFVGSLTGNADTATQAGRAGTAGALGGGGSAGTKNSASATSVDPKATVNVNNALIQTYLNKSEFAARDISLDPGNVLYNQINRLSDYGNVSERTLSTTEIRSKLRDKANLTNQQFVSSTVAEGGLSATFSNAIPKNIGRKSSLDATVRRTNPRGVFGRVIGSEIQRFKGKVPNTTEQIKVNPVYDPTKLGQISSKTSLEQGITIAKFLGGYGNPITFDHVRTNDERVAIAKNLVLHANLLKEIMTDQDDFDDYRLVVAEGIYRPSPTETVTPGSINDLKSKGRAVVYELRDRRGNIAVEKTWELADWWKDSIKFEKMILDYDTYDPSGKYNAQIIMIMPEIKGDYTVTYQNQIETRFNNFVQSTNELIECLQK